VKPLSGEATKPERRHQRHTTWATDPRRRQGKTRRTLAQSLVALLLIFSHGTWVRGQTVGTPLYGWQNVTVQAAFAPRDGAGLLSYNNKLWLLGGWNASTAVFPLTTTNEVWNSTDGAHWTLVKPNTSGSATFNPATDWEGRHMAGWVVFNNKLWIVGGDSNQCHYQTDAWNSSDGLNWTLVTNSLPWGNRVLFYTLVFNNRIWVMGGQTLVLADCPGYPQPETFYNDIWSSNDGATWTQVQPTGPMWQPRGVIWGAVVFNGRMWVLGGGTYGTPQNVYNDVWSSADGVNWTRVIADAPWQPRIYHDITVYDGRMWVVGGHAANGDGNLSDVWSSADGVKWTQVPNTPWLARHAASVAVFNGAMWLTGGTTNLNGSQDDVWKLDRGPLAPIISSQLLQN
jgi:hypothetical protein